VVNGESVETRDTVSYGYGIPKDRSSDPSAIQSNAEKAVDSYEQK
jgi:hypothetical protein